VRNRRHSSTTHPRSTAKEHPKSIELEQRVARVEIAVARLTEWFEALNTRLVACNHTSITSPRIR
jgi:hypothetical protein